jgi:hypothetical protein
MNGHDPLRRTLLFGVAAAGARPAGTGPCQSTTGLDLRAATVPLKVGWLQPDDIWPAAVFLTSDGANMVTGAEYEVTGSDSANSV